MLRRSSPRYLKTITSEHNFLSPADKLLHLRVLNCSPKRFEAVFGKQVEDFERVTFTLEIVMNALNLGFIQRDSVKNLETIFPCSYAGSCRAPWLLPPGNPHREVPALCLQFLLPASWPRLRFLGRHALEAAGYH